MSIWVIERRPQVLAGTENNSRWEFSSPLRTYVHEEKAIEAIYRLRNRFAEYRAVEYIRRPEEGQK